MTTSAWLQKFQGSLNLCEVLQSKFIAVA